MKIVLTCFLQGTNEFIQNNYMSSDVIKVTMTVYLPGHRLSMYTRGNGGSVYYT